MVAQLLESVDRKLRFFQEQELISQFRVETKQGREAFSSKALQVGRSRSHKYFKKFDHTILIEVESVEQGEFNLSIGVDLEEVNFQRTLFQDAQQFQLFLKKLKLSDNENIEPLLVLQRWTNLEAVFKADYPNNQNLFPWHYIACSHKDNVFISPKGARFFSSHVSDDYLVISVARALKNSL